jgi:Holliday junction DNA helicase RuvA
MWIHGIASIYTHVREDACSWVCDREEKALFERLISVSGIGPKLAITVRSGLAVEDVVQAIRGGHVGQLVRIPGVGKKTAERMVLELRDKLDVVLPGRPAAAASQAAPLLSSVEQDVISALVNLGCNRAMAETAIRKAKAAGAGDAFEPLFRRSMEFIR